MAIKKPVRFGGLSWLAREAVRLRRTRWDSMTSQVFADELWTVLSRLKDAPEAGVPAPGGEGAPPTITNVTNVYNDHFTNTYNVTNVTQQTIDGGYTYARSEYYWTRDVVPGTIQDKVSDSTYNVEIQPNGTLISMAPGNTNPTPSVMTVQVTQLQIHPAEIIPPGTQTLVLKIAEFRRDEIEVYSAETKSLSRSRNITELQAAYYMQVPVWL